MWQSLHRPNIAPTTLKLFRKFQKPRSLVTLQIIKYLEVLPVTGWSQWFHALFLAGRYSWRRTCTHGNSVRDFYVKKIFIWIKTLANYIYICPNNETVPNNKGIKQKQNNSIIIIGLFKGNSHMISPDRTRLISILLSNSRLPGHLSPDLWHSMLIILILLKGIYTPAGIAYIFKFGLTWSLHLLYDTGCLSYWFC